MFNKDNESLTTKIAQKDPMIQYLMRSRLWSHSNFKKGANFLSVAYFMAFLLVE